MNARNHGAAAEALARVWLKQHGYRVLESNYRCRLGEIDIICENRGTIVFVEVKSRTQTTFGTPAQAVNFSKQRRLRQTAQHYVIERQLESHPLRFDVISILNRQPPEVEHIIGAF